MSRARAVLALSSLLPVLLLAGCSDDEPQPKFGPTPSATAPTSASTASSSAAALGPEETVRAWVDAQNIALRTGDTSRLEALSHDPCKTCDQFIDPIAQVYSDGGSFQGGAWTVAAAKARSQTESRTVVDVGVEVDGGSTKKSSQAQPVKYEADKHIMEFRLVADGDDWAISFIGFLS
ncbi:DUF6318 family protein [Nocardioides sp. URHA0020]|uniref:DUF6318 family protein n=1 Tax=Nocardioides sp. URHA0020 TaxID=1380392 RepID=UPI0012DEE21F|nr:DUF6318 family protein [Nocardioides sp. URHA0020]